MMKPPPHGGPMGGPPHRHRERKKLTEFSDIVYISPDEITFFTTEGALTGAEYKDYKGRINIVRIFPLNLKNEFLSVQDDDGNELGIIKSLDDFSYEQKCMINEELDRRYFAPEITKVIDVKEEFGNMFWTCETSSGKRSFTVRDLANNLIHSSNGGIILVDTDGNRYTAKNPTALGGKAMKHLDIWL